MMSRFVSHLCLLMAMAAAIAGFTFLLAGQPEPSIAFHRALAAGEEDYATALESRLSARRRARAALIVGLFVAGATLAAAAFLTMRPSGRARDDWGP